MFFPGKSSRNIPRSFWELYRLPEENISRAIKKLIPLDIFPRNGPVSLFCYTCSCNLWNTFLECSWNSQFLICCWIFVKQMSKEISHFLWIQLLISFHRQIIKIRLTGQQINTNVLILWRNFQSSVVPPGGAPKSTSATVWEPLL